MSRRDADPNRGNRRVPLATVSAADLIGLNDDEPITSGRDGQAYPYIDLRIEDFDRRYRFRMVKAYPVISGVPNAYEATHDEIDAGFRYVLDNRHLRRTHEMYLSSGRAAARRLYHDIREGKGQG